MGLTFIPIDLHVHTPASQDFPNPENKITPKDIVNKALKKGLKAIAITDHNTNNWVDRVKAASKGTSLVVFPGIELNVTAGKKGLHLLAIFDPSHNADKIKDLWDTLTLEKDEERNSFHQQDIVLTCTPHEAYSMIERLGGICIPAHVTSSKGILHDTMGLVRKQFFSQDLPLAVEARDWDQDGKIFRTKPAKNFLDGTDPNYNYSCPAIIQGSDCIPFPTEDDSNDDYSHIHSIEYLGDRFTYFKMGEEISLEALRQCFFDHEVRIRQMFQPIGSEFPQLLNISIKGGFLNNSKMDFNPGLNAIIGGKGAGKSLLIEFIRANLMNFSSVSTLQDDCNQKLISQLRVGGEISVIFQTQHEGFYINKLKIMEDGSRSYECKRLVCENGVFKKTSEEFEGEINQLFPINAFSQTEIVRIVETPENLRDMLDGFIDQRKIEDDIQDLNHKIMESDTSYQGLIDTRANIIRLERQIATYQAQKKDITRKLGSKYQEKLRILEQDNLCFINWKKDYDRFVLQLDLIERPFFEIIKADDLSIVNDPLLQALRELIERVREESTKKLKEFSQITRKFNEQVETISKNWKEEYNKKKEEILTYFGEGVSKLEEELELIGNHLEEFTEDLRDAKKRKQDFELKLKERESLLGKLYEKKTQRTQKRIEMAKELSHGTKGIVKVEITVDGDVENLKKSLEKVRFGSNIRKDRVPNLASSSDGRRLAKYFREKNIIELARISGLDKTRVENWIDYIDENRNWQQVLRIEYQGLKNDIPKFYYKENQHYKELRNCSVGQKSAVILVLILSQHRNPLIIDQPEDALDLSTIYKDIVEPIRSRKHLRQFIITSHSSELVVGADSDDCFFLKADAGSGKVIGVGVIEQENIRENLLSFLEGGRNLFETKLKKYGYNKEK